MPSKLGLHEKIYSYMNRDSNGFTSFKINVLKQRLLILFLASPARHLSLNLIFSSNNELLQLYGILYRYLNFIEVIL